MSGVEEIALALALAVSAGMAPFIGLAILSMGLGFGYGTANSATSELTGIGALLVLLGLITLDIVLDKLPAAARIWTPLSWAFRVLAGGLIGWALTETLLWAALAAAIAVAVNLLRTRLAARAQRKIPGLGRFGALAAADFLAAVIGAIAVVGPYVGLALALIAGLGGALLLAASSRADADNVGDTSD